MATYIVGDIQGCYSKLRELLDLAKFCNADTLWCVGDLVNRGAQDLDTLRFLKSLGSQVISVLGNHDLHLLACAYGARNAGKKDTFIDVLGAPDRDEIIDWLRHQPLVHQDREHACLMVHAGIPHIWTIEETLERAAEVENALQAPDPRPFFNSMYGNEPAGWNAEIDSSARLRTITNYFTRMRFCSPDGKLEFTTKSGPGTPPPGYLPWYQYARPAQENLRIVFGHWAAMEGRTGLENVIGLDTGCVWGGELRSVSVTQT